MMRLRSSLRLGLTALLAVAIHASKPTSVHGQGAALSLAPTGVVFPRWEGPSVAQPPRAMRPTPPDSVGGDVFLRSTLGAAGGFAVGALAGVAVCWDRCGDGDFSVFVPAILLGFAGGSLGSALSGCSATREPGCTARVLPWSLLGMVAAVGGGGAVVTATDNLLAGWIAFSAIQGLLTARAIP